MQQEPTLLGYIPDVHNKPTLVFDTGFLVQGSKAPDRNGWYPYIGRHQIAANLSEASMLDTKAAFITLYMESRRPAAEVIKKFSDLLMRVQEINAHQEARLRVVHPDAQLQHLDNARSESDDDSQEAKNRGVHADDGSRDEDDAGSDADADSSDESQEDMDQVTRLAMGVSKGGWPRRYFLTDFDSAATFEGVARTVEFPAPLFRVGHPGYNPAFDEKYASATLGPFDGKGHPAKARVHEVRAREILRFA